MRATNKSFVGPNIAIIGDNNTLTGPNCSVTGDNNTLIGPNCCAKGDNNTLMGPNCLAHGDHNKVRGPNARAVGDHNKVSGQNASAVGDHNKVEDGGDDGDGAGNMIIRGDNHGIAQINSRRFVLGSVGSASISLGGNSGMKIMVDGVEVSPFMTSKKEKTAKKKSTKAEKGKKRTRDDEEEPRFIEGPHPKDIEQDVEAEGDNPSCVICLINKPCCTVLPCMELCLCVACARRLCFADSNDTPKQVGALTCPKCRGQVDAIKRTFQ
jgi:hypothetical protein